MNKKILALLAVLLLAMLTACGGGSNDKDGNTGNNGSGRFDDYKAGAYVEMLVAGTYYMDGIVYMSGLDADWGKATIKMAVDGLEGSVEIIGMGDPIRMLMLDRKMYYLNDEKKVYMVREDQKELDPASMDIFDYTDIKYSTEGSGTIPGLTGVDDKAYAFEEFRVGTGEKSLLLRFYFNGESMHALEIKAGEIGNILVINKLTRDIPDGLIALPSEYKIVDAMSFF